MKKSPAIAIKNLTVRYGTKAVLWNINVDLPRGKVIGLVGPNGAGKTTLIKAIMALVPQEKGTILLYGKPLEEVREHVSYMPQRQSIDWNFPITVQNVVMMGCYPSIGLFRKPRKEHHDRVIHALRKTQIAHLAQRPIGALSGGQQQLVFLARSLAQQADLYLLDEPFAGVDSKTEEIILGVLQQLAKEEKTIVIVHHSLASVAQYCDYTVLVNTYIHAHGPTKEVLQPSLLKKTYGNSSMILDRIAQELGHFPHNEEAE